MTLFGILTPLVGAFALARAKDQRWAWTLLACDFVVLIAVFAVISGVGRFVTDANLGIWYRIAAIPLFGSAGFVSWRTFVLSGREG